VTQICNREEGPAGNKGSIRESSQGVGTFPCRWLLIKRSLRVPGQDSGIEAAPACAMTYVIENIKAMNRLRESFITGQ